jgi:hypothetical protein
MGKIEVYRERLRGLDSWDAFLLAESGLPGPRGNLELVAAAADEGDTPRFLALLEHTAERAPTGTAAEFLAVCGAVGLGESIARGDDTLWSRLRALAGDARWRVREGVAMALQRVGDRDMPELLRRIDAWVEGTLLERRAVVAGLCEPRLLRELDAAEAVLALLDRITGSLADERERRSEPVRVLRQALGYGWSVAIVAAPERGKRRLERLARSADPDVRWIVRENLKKNRLRKLDGAWVERLSERVSP